MQREKTDSSNVPNSISLTSGDNSYLSYSRAKIIMLRFHMLTVGEGLSGCVLVMREGGTQATRFRW